MEPLLLKKDDSTEPSEFNEEPCKRKIDPGLHARLEALSSLAGGVKALAKAGNVSITAIRKYFDVERPSEPSRPIIAEMARSLEVRAGWIVDGLGPMCDPESPVIRRARHLIASEIDKIEAKPKYRAKALASRECNADDYPKEGYYLPLLPKWVWLVVPHIDDAEVKAWRAGKLDFSSANTKNDVGTVGLSFKTVARVAASIRKHYGSTVDRATLPLDEEVYLLSHVCEQCEILGADKVSEKLIESLVEYHFCQYHEDQRLNSAK